MIRKIAPDKWRHFFVGIVMGAVLQSAGYWLLAPDMFWAVLSSFIVVVVISYGFELFSKFTGRGHYEVMDALASIAGGVAGMALMILVLF